jgi:uncharacterized membrane protein
MESSYQHPGSGSPGTQNQLFGLSIDPTTKAHLSETAKWARFLAIVGMVFMSLVVLAIILFAVFFSTMSDSLDQAGSGASVFFSTGLGIGLAFFYIILLGIWFLPLLFLLRFANNMKRALAGDDQQALNRSFQQLKVCYRYIGIITIIILSLYAIGILFGVLGAALFS